MLPPINHLVGIVDCQMHVYAGQFRLTVVESESLE